MLDILADAHELARESELLLDGFEGRDFRRQTVGPEEVPGVETREVLDCAEQLVAASGGGYELEVVGYRGVVDEGVRDHDGGCVAVLFGKVGVLEGESRKGKKERKCFEGWSLLVIGGCRSNVEGPRPQMEVPGFGPNAPRYTAAPHCHASNHS